MASASAIATNTHSAAILMTTRIVLTVALSRVPAEGSLEVAIYDSPDESSKVKDLVEGEDYSYVQERNSILFESDQVPESQQYIKASYRIKSGT